MTISNFAPRTMEELEEIYGNGMTDEMSGNVEAPTGHFYRVESQIVVTDTQGFRSLFNFRNEDEAKAAFTKQDKEYSSWADCTCEIAEGCPIHE
jgi:hypothetical protein